MSGFGRITLIGALLAAGAGVAVVHAQTVLGDPRDAAKTFASNCSACHKSPRGLAKSGQVAGFLRQHYTTGAEMSAAMAAYLVAAGAAPAEKKKTAATDEAAGTKSKGKQLTATPPGEPGSEANSQRQLRGKQRQAKADAQAKAEAQARSDAQAKSDAETQASRPAAAPAAHPPVAEEAKPAAATASLATPPAAAETSRPSRPPLVVLDIPMPELPVGPPADLTQSVFSSSPLP